MTAPQLPGSESSPITPAPNTTTSQFLTTSMLVLKQSLRRLLLDYARPDGANARQYLGESLYIDRAPDPSVESNLYPYACMRLATSDAGEFHGMRPHGTLEVQVYSRPFSEQPLVEAVADLFEQCMLSRTLTRDGLVFCHSKSRQLLPIGPLAVDGEVCTVVLSFGLTIYPQFLTSLTLKPVGP